MKFTFHFDNDGDQQRRTIGAVLLALAVILAELIILSGLMIALVSAITDAP